MPSSQLSSTVRRSLEEMSNPNQDADTSVRIAVAKPGAKSAAGEADLVQAGLTNIMVYVDRDTEIVREVTFVRRPAAAW